MGTEEVKQLHPNAHMMRIVSYNIRHGEGMDGQIDLERIAKVIAALSPDLVALQEVDRGCERSGNRDIAKELGTLLGMEHRFGKFMDFEGGEYGLAVLSSYPVIETIRHPLPDGAEPRCSLEVKVQVAGTPPPVSFICVHNDWTDEGIRLKQVRALLEALKENRNPVVLAGDFNGERTDRSMKLLQGDHWQVLDKGGKKTFPSDKPEVEIDFIVTKHIHSPSVEHDVIDERVASDHRPIFGVIELTTPVHRGL